MQNLIDLISSGDYEWYGLRILPAHAEVGDTLEASYRWEDGDRTEDRLAGTSALLVSGISKAATLAEVFAALEPYRLAWSGKAALIAGKVGAYGEDGGEVVIEDAEVLWVEA